MRRIGLFGAAGSTARVIAASCRCAASSPPLDRGGVGYGRLAVSIRGGLEFVEGFGGRYDEIPSFEAARDELRLTDELMHQVVRHLSAVLPGEAP